MNAPQPGWPAGSAVPQTSDQPAPSPEFYPPAVHQNYPPPGLGYPPSRSPIWKPGVVPLRPLSLTVAPAAVVLERRNIPDAIARSLGLVKGRFWRTLGIIVLAGIVAGLVVGAISMPFSIAGGILAPGAEGDALTVGEAIGGAIGQILITPFLVGMTTLLYVDARIRSEAFDFALSAPGSLDADSVWLDHRDHPAS